MWLNGFFYACKVELMVFRFAWSCVQYHWNLKPQSILHILPPTPRSCQGIVIPTSPTSPAPQVPGSFLRFPADLWSSFWFPKCCLRKSSAVLVGWEQAMGWLTNRLHVFIDQKRESTVWSFLTFESTEMLSSLHLSVTFIKRYEISSEIWNPWDLLALPDFLAVSPLLQTY